MASSMITRSIALLVCPQIKSAAGVHRTPCGHRQGMSESTALERLEEKTLLMNEAPALRLEIARRR